MVRNEILRQCPLNIKCTKISLHSKLKVLIAGLSLIVLNTWQQSVSSKHSKNSGRRVVNVSVLNLKVSRTGSMFDVMDGGSCRNFLFKLPSEKASIVGKNNRERSLAVCDWSRVIMVSQSLDGISCILFPKMVLPFSTNSRIRSSQIFN